ncbi:MAG TPA: F0F1 ATP synthase subunit delta [Candidatus Saccharimonadales bacterium]
MQTKFSRRVVARAVAEKLLAEPTRRSHWIKVLAAYLVEQRADNDVDLILNDIARELLERDGHLLADVTSARKLSDSLRAELTKTLRELTGAKRVELDEKVDATLLGGVVARTPNGELDASVRTRLRQLAAI